ncbi:MAG: OmpA family protein [Pseudazoarcus pumilus]|nr:OmpA family protein [Pseudazoarcus pumilus]
MAKLTASRGFDSRRGIVGAPSLPSLKAVACGVLLVFGGTLSTALSAEERSTTTFQVAQNTAAQPGLAFNISASVAAMEQRNRELEGEVERLRAELAAAQQQLNARSQDSQSEIERLKTQLADRESEMAAARASVETAKQDVAAARADLAIRNQSIVQIDEALTKTRATLAERDARIQELEGQLTRTRADLDAANKSLTASNTELEGRRKVMAELERDLTATRAERDKLQAESTARINALEKDLAASTAALKSSDEALQASRAEVATREQRIAELQTALAAAQTDATSNTQRADKAEQDLETLRAEVAERERIRIEQERQVRIVQTLPPPPPEKPFPVLRHELYEEMRAALGDGSGADSIDQRFIVPADGLFERGSDLFSEAGLRNMRRMAEALKTAVPKFPRSVDWILRIDAHVDDQSSVISRFANKQELTTARAQAVVGFLVDQGLPADRLAGTGYADNHPIDSRTGTEAQQRNRRVELRLAER